MSPVSRPGTLNSAGDMASLRDWQACTEERMNAAASAAEASQLELRCQLEAAMAMIEAQAKRLEALESRLEAQVAEGRDRIERIEDSTAASSSLHVSEAVGVR